MRPRDFDPGSGETVAEYLAQLDAWEAERDRLAGLQADAAGALLAAQGRLTALQTWLEPLSAARVTAAGHADQGATVAARLTEIAARLAEAEAVVADLEDSRAFATARLLPGPPPATPIVLAPVRLQTRWIDGDLQVRVYPDEFAVDAHDPVLTADEATYGEHYWSVVAGATAGDPEETWRQLARRFGALRAAWVVRSSDPAGPAPHVHSRDDEPRPPVARLLPERFAVVAFSGGLPVNLAAAGGPARFVVWGEPVPDPLELPLPGSAAAWWQDLEQARAIGMAMTVPVPDGAPPIDALAVVGVRATEGHLAELLAAQSWSAGVRVLADATPTNNSSDHRAGYGPQTLDEAARAVRDGGHPPAGAGSAAEQLAEMLGLAGEDVTGFAGATADRSTLTEAVRLLVGRGAGGALRNDLDDTGWDRLRAEGPAPALQVGRLPYGVLPATAPARWQPAPGEATAGLAPALRRWGTATGPEVLTDPGDPAAPIGGGEPRRVTADDDADLAGLLLENPWSTSWSAADGTVLTGAAALLGPADAVPSPLRLIADTAPAEIGSLPEPTRTASLLARLATAAKQSAPDAALDTALRVLADAATTVTGTADGGTRAELARTLAQYLDAVSHRFDAWVTAAATERLVAHRRANPGDAPLGVFGWLEDVAPRPLPRSFGHLHAPSLGHAASAAVLRSGFLGERRRAWANVPNADPDARDHLAPLPDDGDRSLPLALDLSSARVRGALWTLDAVRAGQPLKAVLGYTFERDLAAAGLQHHTAAFRKLTRFVVGSALDALEQTREDRRSELAAALATLAGMRAGLGPLEVEVARAQAAADAADAGLARATALHEPFRQLDEQRKAVAARAASLRTQLVAHDRARPAPVHRPFHVNLP